MVHGRKFTWGGRNERSSGAARTGVERGARDGRSRGLRWRLLYVREECGF